MAELTAKLANGRLLRSGWHDEHDPDRLPAGDWLAVDDVDGTQLVYIDTDDLAGDPVAAKQQLYAFVLACGGVPNG